MEAFFKEILEGPTYDAFSTPVGSLIKRGTDESLPGPEWSINMEIVDMVNVGGKEACTACIKAISTIIKSQSKNDKQVFLALVILETVIKNSSVVAPHVSAAFMQDMVSLVKGSKGKKNADEAARLVQQWGLAFEKERHRYPHFFDTYVALKVKGVTFPNVDREGHALAFQDAYEDFPAVVSNGRLSESGLLPHLIDQSSDPQTSQFIYPDSSDPCPPASMSLITNAAEFERLERDLSTVEDKVKLCQEMLLESPGIHADELLAEVVGFLEACRDRLAEVIEAGTQGVLNEVAVGKCLRVHDSVLRTLELEKAGQRTMETETKETEAMEHKE